MHVNAHIVVVGVPVVSAALVLVVVGDHVPVVKDDERLARLPAVLELLASANPDLGAK